MFIKSTFSKIASSATKMGEVLSMGKPVISNSGWGDMELFRDKIENLYPVESCNKEEYRKAIKLLLNDQKEKKSTISPFAQEYFSLENGIEKYYKIYQSLTPQPSSDWSVF